VLRRPDFSPFSPLNLSLEGLSFPPPDVCYLRRAFFPGCPVAFALELQTKVFLVVSLSIYREARTSLSFLLAFPPLKSAEFLPSISFLFLF